MSEHPIDESAQSRSKPAAKAPWHPPTLEEVDYSATDASGVGGVYDFTVYSGSSGP
jgi:hypothetical protein